MGKTILVVDDTLTEQHHVSQCLSDMDELKLCFATNGAAAVTEAQRIKPDLILMDIVMPDMDGFAACRQLKSDQRTQHIPVLLISTKNQPADRVWAQLQGAEQLLAKPCSAETLRAEVSRWL
jgi:twitching motility two-component system response regulator PilH